MIHSDGRVEKGRHNMIDIDPGSRPRSPRSIHARAWLGATALLVGLALQWVGFNREPAVQADLYFDIRPLTTSLPADRRIDDCRRYAEMQVRIRSLVDSAKAARITTRPLGQSAAGRDIPIIHLQPSGSATATTRPAMLIVAGLSAQHVANTEIAMRMAETWANEAAANASTTAPAASSMPAAESKPAATSDPNYPQTILDACDLCIIPRLNVDGAERFLAGPQDDNDLNGQPVDDDRDAVPDDDGPEDLNGDGVITQMRVRDPEATHVADERDPRLIRPADRAEGEKPVYKIYTEGLDHDGDGEYNEDGPGGVDLDRNFTHAYPAFSPGAGRYALCAPESRALAEFVVAHPEILAVVVLDRTDNLINVPPSDARDVTGRDYRDLHPDDVPIWKHLSKRFRDTVQMTEAPKSSADGTFASWVYHQRGLPALASCVWWLPKKEPAKSDATTQTAQPDAASQPTSQPEPRPASSQAAEEPNPPTDAAAAPTSSPASAPATQPTAGSSNTKPDADHPKSAKTDDSKPDPLELDRRWLAYSDARRNGSGFVPWTPHRHLKLGEVEIGGWVPGFRENAPATDRAAIAERHAAFCTELAALLPRPRVAGAKVTRKAPDVFEIELTLVNDAYLPTALAMARTAQMALPIVLRPQVAPDALLAGRRVEKIPYLDGCGGTAKAKWLIRGDAGQTVKFVVFSRQFGISACDVKLEESATGK